jgi:hypothetical protein
MYIKKTVDVRKCNRVLDAELPKDGFRFFDDFLLFFNTK